MNLTPVTSSNLKAIGYDPGNQILQIAFKNGGTYDYYNVPESVYNGLMAASSHGSYFDSHIKKGPYKFKKLR